MIASGSQTSQNLMRSHLRPSPIIKSLRTHWDMFDDPRKPNNNTKHLLTDVLILAFAVFFFQQPSFLAAQRELARRKGKDNTVTLFETQTTPTDIQIRNIADSLSPSRFHSDFHALFDGLQEEGFLKEYQKRTGTYHISLDGVTFHESTQICCPNCNHRQDRAGQTHYYHNALLAVISQPDSPHVLPLPPECIVPQDGHDKQDCEQQAVKRWLAQHLPRFKPETVTFLGDDIYSRVPICRAMAEEYQQYFLFVCKPTSHKKLSETLHMLEEVGSVEHVRYESWNATRRRHEIWHYRYVNEVPLTGGANALIVNWLDLTITDKQSGGLIFVNSWASNHYFSANNVGMWAKVGRSRWKIENEGINVLKNQGYHLEHNFGHGQQNLSNVLFTLNILAFLIHTVLHLADEAYRLIREALKTRKRFFSDVQALLTYMVFESWEALFEFMLDGLELSLSP